MADLEPDPFDYPPSDRPCDNPDNTIFHGDDDAELVRETLRGIMQDKAAPAAAKAQAARTLAEMSQLLGRHQRETVQPGTPVKELSRDDLEAELAALAAPDPANAG